MASRVFRTLDRSLRVSIALVALAWALPALAAAASITVN
ncbi:MAG: hypothetical protein QOJ07_3373, partial [Thermoleophilaceae bacterium]|nr:hypothetical protein [Thermoleophilaceae bacterium]